MNDKSQETTCSKRMRLRETTSNVHRLGLIPPIVLVTLQHLTLISSHQQHNFTLIVPLVPSGFWHIQTR
jgi:hypothetical protein